jgi:ParB family chromosome partitioning protein
LGKGIESLIPKNYISSGKTITSIPLEDIEANEYQPRLFFDDDALKTLSHSIKTHGLAQPIVVRRKGDGYELIAGERRLRACKLAGMATIPAIVRDISDKESLQLALVENLDREDLNPMEEAKGYKRLIDEFAMSQQEIGDLFGKSRSAVANTLRLLKLPAVIQDAVSSGAVSEGHARALLSLESEELMVEYLQRILNESLNVRAVEEAVASADVPVSAPSKKKTANAPEFKQIEKDIKSRLGFKVAIKGSEDKGKVTLSFKSQDQLKSILALFDIQIETGNNELF